MYVCKYSSCINRNLRFTALKQSQQGGITFAISLKHLSITRLPNVAANRFLKTLFIFLSHFLFNLIIPLYLLIYIYDFKLCQPDFPLFNLRLLRVYVSVCFPCCCVCNLCYLFRFCFPFCVCLYIKNTYIVYLYIIVVVVYLTICVYIVVDFVAAVVVG